MLTDEKIILVQLSMNERMRMAVTMAKDGLPVQAGDIRSFGWFGSTFFGIDDEGHVGLTDEGERLTLTKPAYPGERLYDVAKSAYLSERQIAMLVEATRDARPMNADGSDDMDALYLKRCDLVRYSPETDSLYATGRRLLLVRDDEYATSVKAAEGLSVLMTQLGFAAMSARRRKKTLKLAEKYMDSLAEYKHYPTYEQEER